MNKKTKKITALILSMALVISLVSTPLKAEAASKKAIKSVTLKIDGTNVTKKTYQMEKGKSATVKVTVNPKTAKKSVTYKSSKKSAVSVSKKGKIVANNLGTAKITVTVKGKNNKKKSVWFKVKVVQPANKTTQEVTTEKKNPTTEKKEVTTEKKEVTTEKIEATTEKIEATTEKVEATTEKVEVTTEQVEVTTEKVEVTTEKVEATTEKVEATTEQITTEENTSASSNTEDSTEDNKPTVEETETVVRTGVAIPANHVIAENTVYNYEFIRSGNDIECSFVPSKTAVYYIHSESNKPGTDYIYIADSELKHVEMETYGDGYKLVAGKTYTLVVANLIEDEPIKAAFDISTTRCINTKKVDEDSAYDVSIAANSKMVFSFVPKYNMEYNIHVENPYIFGSELYCRIENVSEIEKQFGDGDVLVDYDFDSTQEMEIGKEYYIVISNLSNTDITTSFIVSYKSYVAFSTENLEFNQEKTFDLEKNDIMTLKFRIPESEIPDNCYYDLLYDVINESDEYIEKQIRISFFNELGDIPRELKPGKVYYLRISNDGELAKKITMKVLFSLVEAEE